MTRHRCQRGLGQQLKAQHCIFGTCGRSRCEERGLHAQRSRATGPTQFEGCATRVLSTRQLDLPKLAGRGRLFLCCRSRQRMGYFTQANKNTPTHPHSCSHTRTRHTAHAHDTHAIRVAHDTCTNIRETDKTHTTHVTQTRHAQNTRQTHVTRHVNPRGVRLIVFIHESHLISSSLEITTK